VTKVADIKGKINFAGKKYINFLKKYQVFSVITVEFFGKK
jgi:hypothetical protein